ncbi:MAG: adenosine deaminase, partial [Spirochaetota bacterium]
HLDGGLRPETIVELAEQHQVKLPYSDPRQLGKWFHHHSVKGKLSDYLKGFEITTGVMQTTHALYRVSYEMMEDMKNDGVVYVESRFSPIFHTRRGLSYDQIVDAVLRGMKDGSNNFGVRFGLIICAMRNMAPSRSLEMAKLAVRYRNQGAVGFDLAGDEIGYPPKDHLRAFYYIQRNNFFITIHAGEAFGKESIWQALQFCGTHRIGHGLHLKDDIMISNNHIIEMGSLAQYVLDRRIPLEFCLSSNLHIGAVPDLKYHPFHIFFRNGFRVTLNTDNRLMSSTTLTQEFFRAVKQYNLDLRDIEKLSLNAMKSAFAHFPSRLDIIYNIIKPGYARIKQQQKGKGKNDLSKRQRNS